jgi:hypothetical protein
MDKPKRKLNKRQREQKRIEHANTWNEAFTFAYNLGYEQGKIDGVKEWQDESQRTKSEQK